MIDTSDSRLQHLPDIAGYHVLRRIDAGGQAAVYAAESNSTGRLVAVKVLHDPAAARRLEREARFLSSLRHPGIVTILDAGRDGDRIYLVTDFVEGIPIDDYINVEACGVDDVVELLIAACSAVSAAHAAGILHRDIKPANILVTEGRRCYIVDFGLAADEESSRNSSSSSGSIVGTVDYCPPERLRGAPADFRGDVYALGMVLYECLADNLPYHGETRFDRVRAVVYDEPTRLRRAAAGDRLNELLGPQFISRDLEAVVMKAIAKGPERRYSTVDALAADLRHCRAGEPVEARYGQRGYLARRLLARHRAAVAALAVMVVTLTVGFAWATYSWRVAEESRRRAERAVVHTQTALQMASLQYSGDLARGSGSRDTAVENLERSLRLAEHLQDPSIDVQLQQYNAHYRLAELCFDDGDVGKARHHAEAAIALAPGLIEGRPDQTQSASVQVLIGKIAMSDGRFEDAAAAFLAAAADYHARGPNMSYEGSARCQAGRALERANRWTEALQQFTSAIRLYQALAQSFPGNDSLTVELASAQNQSAAGHLRRKTELDDAEASALINDAMERLNSVVDPARRYDVERLRERLNRNRAIAADRTPHTE